MNTVQKQIDYLKSQGFIKVADFTLSLELTYIVNKESLVYGHIVVKYDQVNNCLTYPYFTAINGFVYSEVTLNTVITRLHLIKSELDLLEL